MRRPRQSAARIGDRARARRKRRGGRHPARRQSRAGAPCSWSCRHGPAEVSAGASGRRVARPHADGHSRTGSLNGDGSFDIPGVLPGSYIVYQWAAPLRRRRSRSATRRQRGRARRDGGHRHPGPVTIERERQAARRRHVEPAVSGLA
jgi:hypothetical protein